MLGSNLSPLGYSYRDYSSIVAALQNLLPSYIPSINDTSIATSFTLKFLSVISGVTDIMSGYIDIQVGESSLAQCQQLRNAIAISTSQLFYKLQGKSSSMVNLTFTNPTPVVGSPLDIPKWTEVDSNTTSLVSYITILDVFIPVGETTISVDAIQASIINNETLINSSNGSVNQIYRLSNTGAIRNYMNLTVGGVQWNLVDDLMDYGSTDNVFEIIYDEYMNASVVFGDGINGTIPSPGSTIVCTYLITLGSSGMVSKNVLTSMKSQIGSLTVTNLLASSGGGDGDTISTIRNSAPGVWKSIKRAVTNEDYQYLANQVSGVYSSLANITNNGWNVNVVVFPIGGGQATQTLLTNVYNYISPKTIEGLVLTTSSIQLANILMSLNIVLKSIIYDKNLVKQNILNAIKNALSYQNVIIGVGFRISDIAGIIDSIDGVSYVDNIIFTRYPTVIQSNLLDSSAIVSIFPGVTYSDWTIVALANNNFSVYKGSVLVGLGTVDTLWSNSEISIMLQNSIIENDTWTFTTSIYNGNIELNPQEIMALNQDSDITLNLYYPYEYKGFGGQ